MSGESGVCDAFWKLVPDPCPSWQAVQPNFCIGCGLDDVRYSSGLGCVENGWAYVLSDDERQALASSVFPFRYSSALAMETSCTSWGKEGTLPLPTLSILT